MCEGPSEEFTLGIIYMIIQNSMSNMHIRTIFKIVIPKVERTKLKKSEEQGKFVNDEDFFITEIKIQL